VNNTFSSDSSERLIRVLADRQGATVEIRVQYEVASLDGCRTFRIIKLEDIA
jgi:hypothetical protein